MPRKDNTSAYTNLTAVQAKAVARILRADRVSMSRYLAELVDRDLQRRTRHAQKALRERKTNPPAVATAGTTKTPRTRRATP